MNTIIATLKRAITVQNQQTGSDTLQRLFSDRYMSCDFVQKKNNLIMHGALSVQVHK